MNQLPDAREDGWCVDCLKRKAQTTDGRFCGKCLRRRLAKANPIAEYFSDERGRPARDSRTLGGCPKWAFEDEEL